MQLFDDLGYIFRYLEVFGSLHDHDQSFSIPFRKKCREVASSVVYAALLGFDYVLSELLETWNEQFSQTEEHTNQRLAIGWTSIRKVEFTQRTSRGVSERP